MNGAYQTYSFGELFHPLEKGIQKLTESAVYNSLDSDGELLPLWGGNQAHDVATQFISNNGRNNEGKKIKIFEGECLIISLDGSAGSMTYKKNGERFVLNHHAGVLKNKNAKILNMEYFKYRFEGMLRGLAVSDGSKTLSKEVLEQLFFDLPELKAQLQILERYKKINSLRNKITSIQERIQKVESKKLTSNYAKSNQEILFNVFDIIQGHQITDYELYYTEGSIPVYTGNNELKGHWNRSIVSEEALPCLTYPTKGNSGVAFIQTKIFDANNTAVLVTRDKWKNKVVLEWFKYKLPFAFLDCMTSKEGVSYLNKEIVQNLVLEIPDTDQQKKEIISFKKIERLKSILDQYLLKADHLLELMVV